MKIAHGLGIKNLEAYGDSQLIVCQVQGLYAVRKPDLIPYYEATMRLAQKFKNFYVEHLSRRQNAHADALASLARLWPFLRALLRRYGFIRMTYSVPTRRMKRYHCYPVPRLFKHWQIQLIETGGSRTSTTACLTYFRMILKRRRPSNAKPYISITMQPHKHCI